MSNLLTRVDQALNTLYRYCGYVAALCLILIGVLVCLSIISRLASVYVPGLTEYSGYAMAAASFLALSYAFHENAHVRVEILISRLPRKFRCIAEVWCLSIAVCVSVYLSWYMIRLTYYSWKFHEFSEGADAILLWKPQSVVAIGSVLLAVAVIHHFLKCLFSRSYQPR